MRHKFVKTPYPALHSRQQEAYNFQKVSALLADYGFVTIRLSSDWNGADFIAQHFDGATFLKVQLKGRLSFYKKYVGQDLYICFREIDNWYLYPHDELLDQLLGEGFFNGTKSWDVEGGFSVPRLSKRFNLLLEPYRLGA